MLNLDDKDRQIAYLEKQLAEKDKEIKIAYLALQKACLYITSRVDKDVNKMAHEWAEFYLNKAREELK